MGERQQRGGKDEEERRRRGRKNREESRKSKGSHGSVLTGIHVHTFVTAYDLLSPFPSPFSSFLPSSPSLPPPFLPPSSLPFVPPSSLPRFSAMCNWRVLCCVQNSLFISVRRLSGQWKEGTSGYRGMWPSLTLPRPVPSNSLRGGPPKVRSLQARPQFTVTLYHHSIQPIKEMKILQIQLCCRQLFLSESNLTKVQVPRKLSTKHSVTEKCSYKHIVHPGGYVLVKTK